MEGCFTTCSPWNLHHTQGGHILNCCRDGVRYNSPSPWRILQPLSTIFSAWPIRLCIQPQNSYADYLTSSPPVLTSRTATSSMIYRLLPMFSSVMMLFVNPYDGPCRVIKKTDKHFTIDINSHNDTVSINCLKPAYLDTDNFHPTSLYPQPLNLSLWSTCPLPSVTLTTNVIRHWGGVV